MSWVSRNAPVIEAAAACVTAAVAVGALVGVKIQLDETDRLQREQSARESYRAHLAIAVEQPNFAQPQDACALLASDSGGAYVAFVDHLLYSAEQMLGVTQGWEDTFLDQLAPHEDYLCSSVAPLGETDETTRLLAQFKKGCPKVPVCG